MVKVLYLIGDLGLGGAETHLVHVLSNLDRGKYAPYVACFRKIGQYVPQVEALNIPVLDLGIRRVYDIKGTLKILSFSKYVKKEKIDIIHAYLYKPNIFGVMVGKKAGIPVIISTRSLSSFLPLRQQFVYQKIALLADRVTAVSDEVKAQDIALGIPAEKIVTIYNGVKLQDKPSGDLIHIKQELGIPPDYSVIATVANLKPAKGLNYLLEAAAGIICQNPKVKILLVGEGRLRTELVDLAHKLKITDNVIFAGHREDVERMLAIMDIFVLPSLEEGMSNALLEAMAAGLPCVVTGVGGNPEVVHDNICGYIVPPKEPVKMAQAVCRLLDDRKSAQAMGIKAKERAMSKFTINEMISQIERLYCDVLGTP